MEDFILIIHRDFTSEHQVPTPEEMKEAMKPYQDWIAGIAASGNLAVPPKRWDLEGRVLKKGDMGTTVNNGPFRKGRKAVGGLVLIKCNDYDEAVKIAEGCPIIKYGAVVEVRRAIPAA
jgi:hypothetical protein